jgi:hypothetical protein
MNDTLFDRLRWSIARRRARSREVGLVTFVDSFGLPGTLPQACRAVLRQMGGQSLGPSVEDLRAERWRLRGAVLTLESKPGFEDDDREFVTISGRMTEVERVAKALRRELRMGEPAPSGDPS